MVLSDNYPSVPYYSAYHTLYWYWFGLKALAEKQNDGFLNEGNRDVEWDKEDDQKFY
jgi:hypothetical protein